MTRFRPNLSTLVAIAAAVVLGSLWWHASNAAARARRGQEAAELEAKDLVVAKEASAATIRALLDDSARMSTDFAAALKKALAAAPGSHTVTTISGSTGPVTVGVPPGASAPSPSAPSPVPASCPCLLKPGDQGQIDVRSAELKTEAGNRILVQAAEASRVEADGSEVHLFGGELRADLTKYLSTEITAETAPGWGVGLIGSLGADGIALGPVLAFPLVRLLGLQIEASAGLTVIGDVRAFGLAVVRNE